jgi:hypothetical protein
MDAAAPLLVNRGLGWKRTLPERYRGEGYWEAFERDVGALVVVFGSTTVSEREPNP